ncbi:MAG: 2,3-bisphosphoglycerate-independent phosphoglycerate mutase [Actinomycetota bacterium]
MSGRVPLVALVILDGWGLAPPGPGNAVELADTPVFDRLWAEYPHTTLEASGEAVGLPPGQMGNSEVGHLTIGSGRILFQDLMRVNKAIEDGSFFESPALVSAFERGENVHLLGLVSYGGVHSHMSHLQALLQFAPEKTWIHAFTDGRDVSPNSAVRDLAELPADRIATVAGRYYAMDRDKHWDRTDKAFEAIVSLTGSDPVNLTGSDPVNEVLRSYESGVTDEFIVPMAFEGRPRLRPGDSAIFFNFRPDRARQLTERLLAARLDVTTMTRYRDDFDCPVVFQEQEIHETMAEICAEHGIRQLHVAETEKYAHVTYFFNGGREDEWSGERRILVPSPRDVPSYDHKPEMSAAQVAHEFDRALAEDGYGFAVVNIANPDMVGHTGSIPAAVKAVEAADAALGRILAAVEREGGTALVTADHGNAEQMLDADGKPQTAHTSNPVPLVVSDRNVSLREGGELSDLVPTAISLLGLAKPLQMSGHNLIVEND